MGKKQNKRRKDRKRRNKTHVFPNGMTVYIEIFKNSTEQ